MTLKEMVAAYGTVANGGDYLEPRMIIVSKTATGTSWKNSRRLIPKTPFPPRSPTPCSTRCEEPSTEAPGRPSVSRFGIRADVAGKTGTTQDNADGWSILMHPQLVAGAWVGFNDPRVTLRSDYWDRADSALLIVGEVFCGVLRSRLIDSKVRFIPPDDTGLLHRRESPNGSGSASPAHPESVKEETSNAPIQRPKTPAQEADPLQEVIDRIIEEKQSGRQGNQEMGNAPNPDEQK